MYCTTVPCRGVWGLTALGALVCTVVFAAPSETPATGATVTAMATDPAAVARLAQEALTLKRSGQPQAALAKTQHALRADPTNKEAHWVAAWILAETGRRTEATAEFQAFVNCAPGDERLDAACHALERLSGSAPAAAPRTDREALEDLLETGALKGTPERLGGGVMVKYKLRLEDGSAKGRKAVFKPRQTGSQSFVYEIAAYRIDRLCGMGHVPVTVKRDLPRSALAAAGLSDRLRLSGDLLGGSVQQWVDNARDPLGSGARSWGQAWLTRLSHPGGSVPDVATARAVSDMVLLDYLQGNMDRFSGGNVLEDAAGKLWFIDNSEAFGSSSRPRQDFDRVKRFDRGVIEALRKATEVDFTRDVGPWLTASELRGLLERRRHALQRVEELVGRYGDSAVYL
ncbi:hypothetical protein LLH03_05615 [bacterium]|nr:hypothetical protein [bacterium]